MTNRKRDYRKKIWISDAEKDRATRIRERLGITDADIFEKGLDDLVSEEYQGNAAIVTYSKRAQLFHNIPEDEWEGLSEDEKLEYISKVPGVKLRAGGEPMGDRSPEYQAELDQWAQDRSEFFANEMRIISDRRAEKARKYDADRRG